MPAGPSGAHPKRRPRRVRAVEVGDDLETSRHSDQAKAATSSTSTTSKRAAFPGPALACTAAFLDLARCLSGRGWYVNGDGFAVGLDPHG